MSLVMSQTSPQAMTLEKGASANGPKVLLRVLVISGQDHRFTFEPTTTVRRMKELIWSMWPPAWTDPSQPPSPSWLRVLYAGRVLADDSTLEANNLPVSITNDGVPTVIHLSVRSFEIKGDDEAKKIAKATKEARRQSAPPRNREEDVGGCSCVIM